MRPHATRSALASSVAVALLLLTACGGSSSDSTLTGPTVPSKTTTYVGTFGDGSQTGTLSLTIAAASSDISPNVMTANSVPTITVATGTLVTIGGTTVQLTGTFDAASGALLLSGGSYAFTGTLTNGLLGGNFSATHGIGNFTAQAPSSTGTPPKLYCGTYAAPGDFGWFNLVISTSGTVTGFSVPFAGSNGGVSLTGSLAGSTISLVTSQSVHTTATLSADGSSLTGNFTPNGGGVGTYSGSVAGCGSSIAGSGGTVTPNVVAGSWGTQGGASTPFHFQLLPTGSSLSGAGTLTTPPIAPTTGPATPAYTGDDFTITSGSFTSPSVTFTASLGANPVGDGTFFHGTLSFSGTASAGTMTGTLTFTPPRTSSQIFGAQTVTGVTLTKQ